jgi:alpha-1,2-mannosyltransferase
VSLRLSRPIWLRISAAAVPWRRILLALSMVLVCLTAARAIWTIFYVNPGWAYDTGVYRMGASIVLQGGDLYAASTPFPYTYAPFSALLFIPLTLLSPQAMSVAWTALSLAAFIVVTWLTLGRLGFARGGRRVALTAIVCLVAVWLDPIADTLLAGQVNLVVIALVLTDLLLPDSSRWKGIGVGIAANFKLLPLFFVIYLLATRRVASALRAIGAFGATVLIGFIALPRDSLTYWSGTFLDSTRVGNAQNPRSESLLSLLVRWSHTATAVRPLWLVLEVVVAVGVLTLAVWVHRRGDEFLAILVAAAGPLVLSPITWRHHWVWILPMVLWLIRSSFAAPLAGRQINSRPQLAGQQGGGRHLWLWIPIALIALDFYLRPYGAVPVDFVADLHLDLGQLILSSTHVASLFIFLASALAIVLGSPRPRRQALTESS